jgi:hypothetical protein
MKIELNCMNRIYLQSRAAAKLVTMKASTDPDTKYYHQEMREPDKEKFQRATRK